MIGSDTCVSSDRRYDIRSDRCISSDRWYDIGSDRCISSDRWHDIGTDRCLSHRWYDVMIGSDRCAAEGQCDHRQAGRRAETVPGSRLFLYFNQFWYVVIIN